jgi:pimeloyl-ACP methyl ester carboxylesterase
MKPFRRALRWIFLGIATLAGLGLTGCLVLILWGDPELGPAPEVSLEDLAASGLDFSQDYPARPGRFRMRDDIELAAQVHGSDPATTILLVHGVLSSSFPLNSTAGLLHATTGARVVAIDLRGHGASGGRPGDVDHIGQYEDDLGEVVRQLRTEVPAGRVILAGHSMGGGIVLRYAERADSPAVDGYLLYAPYLGWEAPTTPKTSSSTGAEFLKIHLPRLLGLAALNAVGIESFNGLRVQFFNLPPEMPLRSYSYRASVSGAPDDYRRALAKIDRPLLVLVGEKDEAFVAEQYPAAIAGHGQVTILSGATHNTALRAPEGLAVVDQWLQGVSLRPRGE